MTKLIFYISFHIIIPISNCRCQPTRTFVRLIVAILFSSRIPTPIPCHRSTKDLTITIQPTIFSLKLRWSENSIGKIATFQNLWCFFFNFNINLYYVQLFQLGIKTLEAVPKETRHPGPTLFLFFAIHRRATSQLASRSSLRYPWEMTPWPSWESKGTGMSQEVSKWLINGL